ncbi:MAG: hypothetical protein GY854_32455 [Deltaproteobacteria bacterium]|nr:hypothetical protein [Deltaproteobacteria bacterium]
MEGFGAMWLEGGTPSPNPMPYLYRPDTDSWSAIGDVGNFDHPAMAWDGTYIYRFSSDGGRYNPTTTATLGFPNNPTAPSGSVEDHTAIWADTTEEFIVWGGGYPITDYGAAWHATNGWRALPDTNAPSARAMHTTVWTGTEMIIWGGGDDGMDTGGRYNPSNNQWQSTSTGTNCPYSRTGHTAIWNGDRMIIWGGVYSDWEWNDGGMYNPTDNTWQAMSTSGAPHAREAHTAIWTGTEMIIWGGLYIDGTTGDRSEFNTGGHYNPATNTWKPTIATNAPQGRYRHVAVWTGEEMIVWGGKYKDAGGGDVFLGQNHGYKYHCVSN